MTPYDNGTGKAVKRPTSGVDQRPTREEAEAAVETLIRWMGETPEREGLRRHAGARRPRLGRVLRRL